MTTDYQITYQENEQYKEYLEAKSIWTHHSCTRPAEGYCDVCDRYERAERMI